MKDLPLLVLNSVCAGAVMLSTTEPGPYLQKPPDCYISTPVLAGLHGAMQSLRCNDFAKAGLDR